MLLGVVAGMTTLTVLSPNSYYVNRTIYEGGLIAVKAKLFHNKCTVESYL